MTPAPMTLLHIFRNDMNQTLYDLLSSALISNTRHKKLSVDIESGIYIMQNTMVGGGVRSLGKK